MGIADFSLARAGSKYLVFTSSLSPFFVVSFSLFFWCVPVLLCRLLSSTFAPPRDLRPWKQRQDSAVSPRFSWYLLLCSISFYAAHFLGARVRRDWRENGGGRVFYLDAGPRYGWRNPVIVSGL